MPNFYAHQVFGELVYRCLPEQVRGKLSLAAWQCGLYGPDPLFFYHPLKSNPVSQDGHLLHGEAPQTVLNRIRSQTLTPEVLGYAAGFLCHYVLDYRCHPIVDAASQGKSLRHAIIEADFDRRLAKGRRTDPIPQPDQAVCEGAAACYQNTDAVQYAKALRGFRAAASAGAWLRRVTPERKAYRRVTGELERALHGAVGEGAALVTRLIQTLEQGGALDFLPALDFRGRSVKKSRRHNMIGGK